MENQDKKEEVTQVENSTKNDTGRDIFERTSHYDPLSKKDEAEPESQSAAKAPNGNIKIESPFFKKLENFFYHYKWHTIIAAFLIFAISLCVFQTCKRTSYDAYVLYAGGKNLRNIEEGETDSTFVKLSKTLKFYVGDYDGDGEKNLSFSDIYLPAPDELSKDEEGYDPFLKDNDELFRNNMLSGNYYVCMISEHLFEEWTKDDNNPFAPIATLLPKGAQITEDKNGNGYRLASEYGVYLSSTPLNNEPGFEYLPEDTILCIRKYSSASAPGKKGRAVYDNSLKLFRAMLNGEVQQ